MPFPKNLQPILLAALSAVATSNPASAEANRLYIEADRTEARIEFCTTKEDCKFIHFSGILPEKSINEEANQKPIQEDRGNNFIDKINDQIFGLLGF